MAKEISRQSVQKMHELIEAEKTLESGLRLLGGVGGSMLVVNVSTDPSESIDIRMDLPRATVKTMLEGELADVRVRLGQLGVGK